MTRSISTKSYQLVLQITVPFLWAFSLACAGLALWSATMYAEGSPYDEPNFPFLSWSILYAFTGLITFLWCLMIFILSFLRKPNPVKGQYLIPRHDFLGKFLHPVNVTLQSLLLWCFWTTCTIMATVRQTKQCVYSGNDYTCTSDTILLFMGWFGWAILTVMIGFFIAYSVAAKRELKEGKTEFLNLGDGSNKVSSEGKI